MIEISELYLINTVDKNPYVWTPDPLIFSALTASKLIDLTILSLTIIEGNAFKMDSCFKAYMEYDLATDFEDSIPFVASYGLIPSYAGNPIYNYKFMITLESDNTVFNSVFKDQTRYFGSQNWQIVYKSEGQWFICYAEFQLVNTKVNNNIVQPLMFESKNSKEEIYRIVILGTS